MSVLLCSKESKWYEKIEKNFGVDWLYEKKNDGKESEKNFENETSLENKLKKKNIERLFRWKKPWLANLSNLLTY